MSIDRNSWARAVEQYVRDTARPSLEGHAMSPLPLTFTIDTDPGTEEIWNTSPESLSAWTKARDDQTVMEWDGQFWQVVRVETDIDGRTVSVVRKVNPE